MKVVAFVGPSGTGKSHRAIGIAHKIIVMLLLMTDYLSKEPKY